VGGRIVGPGKAPEKEKVMDQRQKPPESQCAEAGKESEGDAKKRKI